MLGIVPRIPPYKVKEYKLRKLPIDNGNVPLVGVPTKMKVTLANSADEVSELQKTPEIEVSYKVSING